MLDSVQLRIKKITGCGLRSQVTQNMSFGVVVLQRTAKEKMCKDLQSMCTTSFPGSSLYLQRKDPGCGWSRDLLDFSRLQRNDLREGWER